MENNRANTICLCYGGAEDAVRFYAETFPASSASAAHHSPKINKSNYAAVSISIRSR